jgi:hypothetical protein
VIRLPFPRRSPAPEPPPAADGAGLARGAAQVRLIELRTRGLVNSIFSGEYQSVFRGQGMEFSECASTSRATTSATSTGT